MMDSKIIYELDADMILIGILFTVFVLCWLRHCKKAKERFDDWDGKTEITVIFNDFEAIFKDEE